jgi:hypothetical protein
MRKAIWTGLCTVVVGFATAAITAQTTPTPQSNPSSNDKQITVTGCLKEAPASSASPALPNPPGPPGTAGTTGTPGAPGTARPSDAGATAPQFVLTNATASSAEPSGAANPPEAAPAGAASASAAQTYRLIANPTALSPHVGKKIEVTGTLEDQGNPSQSAQSAAGSEANAPALRAKSAKIIAPSCSQ